MTKRRPTAKRRDINDLHDLRVALYCRVSQDTSGVERSVDDQEREGRRWVERHQALLADVYRDNDRSASRFATKERDEFNRLQADIEAGKLDVVWFWELSRSQRRLGVFAELRDLCRDLGVLWVVSGRVYDLGNYTDAMALGMFAVMSESESEQTSARVLRTKASTAAAGRPGGLAPYGYRPDYDRTSGRLVQWTPDTWDGDGRPMEDSPAWIVREIFDRVAAGDTINVIRLDLHERGIPSPRGKRWSHAGILVIVRNPAYISQRVHQGEVLQGVRAVWEPLVSEETFWAVQQVLTDPRRAQFRPGRARRLLSNLIRCAECGGAMVGSYPMASRNGRQPFYRCTYKYCTGIVGASLDEYVEKVIVRWLSDPAVYADLSRVNDSEAASAARAEAARLRAELAELHRAAKDRAISVAGYVSAEEGLLRGIEEAERLAQAAALPPVLLGNIGPHAQAGWDQLDLPVKREIIRQVADIRVRRCGRGRKDVHPVDRVEWRWLLGPGSEGGDAIADPE